eukprot:TRINITY_DN6282_c0_g1_i1.p3 TRINITY_DN6282_c0_g1~~TRINITY_DN6282_c0_g1_i1.p3  ORF type:complete len:102 (+),score=19.49 TRINITY_DN6282_c0_g1_i1:152-457(+)
MASTTWSAAFARGSYILDVTVMGLFDDPKRAAPIKDSPLVLNIAKVSGHDAKLANLRQRIPKVGMQTAYSDGRARGAAENADHQRLLLKYAFGELEDTEAT